MNDSGAVRNYRAIATLIEVQADRAATMQHVVDRLWDALADTGVSWVGFYTKDPSSDQLLLGPRRDKPACSPIGMHGVCGLGYRTRQAIVVADVKALGSDYVACDPRDRSEVVVPLLEVGGSCWGVLDLDSFDVGAFEANDVEGLASVLAAAGFRTPPPEPMFADGSTAE